MKKAIFIILLFSGIAQGANEIRCYYTSSQTLYATIRNSTGQAFDTTGNVFENWNVMTDYDISLTDHSGGMYTGTFDSDVTAGQYTIMVYNQMGANPADTDPPIQFEEGYWTGTVWKSSTNRLEEIHTDTNELQTDWTNGGRLDLILDAIKKYTDLMVVLETDVNEPNDADFFTVTDGNSTADLYNGYIVMIQDATDSHWETRIIEDWGTDLSMDLSSDLDFTPEANDLVYILNISFDNIWSKVQSFGNVNNIINTIDTTQKAIYDPKNR